jgi:hypothetical protein
MRYLTRVLIALSSLPLFGAESEVHIEALDFSSQSHYAAKFQHLFPVKDPRHHMVVESGKLVHRASASGGIVFAYDTLPDDKPSNLFRDVTIGFDLTCKTRNVSFGIYFGGVAREESCLVLINQNTNGVIRGEGKDLAVRFFTKCNPSSGSVGELYGQENVMKDQPFAEIGATYRVALAITYVTKTSANVRLTISDPTNPLATFESLAEGMPMPAVGGEIAFRSAYVSHIGRNLNTFDNITLSARRDEAAQVAR